MGNVLPITVEWGQDGEDKGKQVLNAGTRSYTITVLEACSFYDVRVTYKYMPDVDVNDREN